MVFQREQCGVEYERQYRGSPILFKYKNNIAGYIPRRLAEIKSLRQRLVGTFSKAFEIIRKREIMKRYGFIYERICDIENIKAAIYNASKRKRKRPSVAKILKNVDYYAEEI